MKSAGEIWDDVPGVLKMFLFAGIFFKIVPSFMDWFGSATWWNTIQRTIFTIGDTLFLPGLVLCAAALVAGGLAAIARKDP